MTSRRTLLGLAAAGVLGAVGYRGVGGLRRYLAPAPEVEPIAQLAGFRRVAGGAVSRGAPLFAGIDEQVETPVTAGNVCRYLFDPRPAPGAVPIAYFSDYRCPNCRVVSRVLKRMEDAGAARITWHEWPILGEASRRAARAALAARRQGAHGAFHEHMMGSSFLPTSAYLDEIAREAGIDAGRLRRDMADPAITRELALTDAVASLFGFIGTPSLVIGRTAATGLVERPFLDRLIAIENEETAPNPCVRAP